MLLINRLTAIQKIMISAGTGILLYCALIGRVHALMLHLLMAWDAFCLLFLVLTWITFFTTRARQIRAEARIQNEGRVAVFIIALIATLAALLAVVLMLVNRTENYREAVIIIIAFGGMILSWALVHTVFAVRYAHIFYDDDAEHKEEHAGGLDFPGQKHPDFLDFAYFSFVIGMTFQVSDVAISSARLRRLVLLHSLIAFSFNTVIVALTINVIAGLSS